MSKGLFSQKTLSVRISSTDGDLEEWLPARSGQTQSKTVGALDNGSSDLEFGTEASGNDPQLVGLRFTNINIPKGAIILSAYIQFTVDATNKNSDPCKIYIKGEASDSALIFDPNSAYNLSLRNRTTHSIIWDVTGNSWSTTGSATSDQRTPNLKKLIESIIGRNGWKNGNPIALFMYGNGTREVESYDGDAPKAPLLVINYIEPQMLSVRVNGVDDDIEEWTPAKSGQTQSKTVGSLDNGSSDLELGTEASGNDPQMSGIRFNNINIPKGSIITKAYIQFTVDATNKNSDPCNIIIKGEVSDSAKAYNVNAAYDLTSRTRTSDSITWNVTGTSWGTVGAATAEQQTPDLKVLVESIINRNGWKKGNPIAFNLYGTGTREVESYDGDAPKAPLLVIEYIPVKSMAIRISSADDDQEEWLPAKSGQTQSKTIGALDNGSSDLEFGTEASGNDPQLLGLRFNNISLPQGAIIKSAYIQFTVDATNKNSDPCQVIIKAENSDTPSVFNTAIPYNISNRQKSSDSVVWNVSGGTWATIGAATADQRTSDLKPLIDGIVNRKGWNSGQPIAFFMHGSGTREVESYDGDAAKAPLLVIEYLGGESGPVVKPRIPMTTYPIVKKSNWLYLDSGKVGNGNWTARNYNPDTLWSFGKGPLGFGELGFTGTEINGGPSTNRYTTAYFRKPFLIPNLSALTDTLELQVMVDDGAVIYVNGTEVVRKNMASGTVGYKTKANKRAEQPFERVYWLYYVPKTLLRADTNVIAAEVHQYDSLSSDVLFDLALNNRKYKANPIASGCINSSGHISCFTSVVPTEQVDTLSIPTTHRFQSILQTGNAYSTSGTVPSNFDFTGYVANASSSRKGWVALNHEKSVGGVSILNVQYNCNTGNWDVDSIHPVDFSGDLVKTASNCSGGVTPWGTTVTCEEDAPQGDVNNDGYEDIGWNVEIDPVTHKVKEYGNGKPEKLWAMGRMSHENIVFAQDSITSYYGEDEPDGNVFKFVAAKKTDLSSGTLYALKLNNVLNSSGDPTGTTGSWVVVPNTSKSDRNYAKMMAKIAGATAFNGVEDVEISPLNNDVFFTAKGVGRTYRFTDNGTTVSNFATFVGGETYPINYGDGIIAEEWAGGNDNLTFDDKGNLWVLQDGGRNHVWMVRPDHTQAQPKIELFMVTPTGSEPTGMTFTPDYQYMFISIQEPSGRIAQKDVKGTAVTFDKSTTLVVARKEKFIPANPASPVITGPASAIKGSTQNYSVVKNSGSIYNWTISNGTQISGGTTNAIAVTWNNSTTGEVNVTEAVNNRCNSNSKLTVILQTSDIATVQVIPGLSLYPNPAENAIFLKSDVAVKYEVWSVQGQQVLSGDHSGTDNTEINVESLPSGVYTVKVYFGHQTQIIQFVKY
ncbi:MAG: alkaline phosphatase PhoX [Bacteroidota bacterium]